VLAWVYVALTVVLTVYGQLVYKWLADEADPFPAGTGDRISYVARLALDPWMVSVGVATLAAAITWFLALKRLELSIAYPFMSLSFVFVLLLSGVFFGESVTFWKTVGIALIVVGVAIGSKV
jgi:multidrug transporter EmrE-like cation transporter